MKLKQNIQMVNLLITFNSIDDQERILGWINDAQTIEKINSQITKSRLNTLINYLSP